MSLEEAGKRSWYQKGSNISIASTGSMSSIEESTYLDLSPLEVASVQAAWEAAVGKNEDKDSPGLTAFKEIFMQMEEIRALFGFTGFDDPNFIRHTRSFCAYLNKLMQLLSDKPQFDNACDELGRIHAHVRSMKFRPSLWETFVTCIIACALDETNISVQISFRKVILYMVTRVKEAYNEESYHLPVPPN